MAGFSGCFGCCFATEQLLFCLNSWYGGVPGVFRGSSGVWRCFVGLCVLLMVGGGNLFVGVEKKGGWGLFLGGCQVSSSPICSRDVLMLFHSGFAHPMRNVSAMLENMLYG